MTDEQLDDVAGGATVQTYDQVSWTDRNGDGRTA
jgi:hypothetical protein